MLINRIAKLRGKLITQDELAKELNLSRNTISKIENGKYAPTVDLAFKIKKVIEKLTLEKTGVTLRLSFEQYFLWVDEEEDGRKQKIGVEFPSESASPNYIFGEGVSIYAGRGQNKRQSKNIPKP